MYRTGPVREYKSSHLFRFFVGFSLSQQRGCVSVIADLLAQGQEWTCRYLSISDSRQSKRIG